MSSETNDTSATVTQLDKKLKKRHDKLLKPAQPRARTMPLVAASVDTKLISKPETFSGKDAERPRWSLTLRASLEAVSGRMLEPLKTADNPHRLDRVDFEPGDDVLDHNCTSY